MAKRMPQWQAIRPIILFFYSLAGITWEIVIEDGERPTLLILLGLMVGLDLVSMSIGGNGKNNDRGKGNDEK
jgi:hypothetical protein